LAAFCRCFYFQTLTEGPSNKVAQSLCSTLLDSYFPVSGEELAAITERDERTVWHAAGKLNEFLNEFSASLEPFKSTKTRIEVPRGPKGGRPLGYWLACFSYQENRYLTCEEIRHLFSRYAKAKVVGEADMETLEVIDSLISAESGPAYDFATLSEISLKLLDMSRRDLRKVRALCDSTFIRKVAVSITAAQNVQWAGVILNDFKQADPTVASEIAEWMKKEDLANHLMSVLKSAGSGNEKHAVSVAWWTIDVIYAVNREAARDVWHPMSEQNAESIVEATGLRVVWQPSGWYLTDEDSSLRFSWGSLLRKGLSWVEYPPDGYGDKI
jgi:hypothetical protein